MKTKHNVAVWGVAAALAASLGMTGCFGDNNDDNNVVAPPLPVPLPTAEVPASASLSVGGFIAYLQSLVVSPADTLEPVNTASVTGSTDETSEPLKVD